MDNEVISKLISAIKKNENKKVGFVLLKRLWKEYEQVNPEIVGLMEDYDDEEQLWVCMEDSLENTLEIVKEKISKMEGEEFDLVDRRKMILLQQNLGIYEGSDSSSGDDEVGENPSEHVPETGVEGNGVDEGNVDVEYESDGPVSSDDEETLINLMERAHRDIDDLDHDENDEDLETLNMLYGDADIPDDESELDDDDDFSDDLPGLPDGGESDISDSVFDQYRDDFMSDEEIDSEDETEFEKREKKILREMELLEDENVKEKSWQESGEVTKKQREKDELLDEVLTFEHASRPPPLITEDYNDEIEEMIVHRITNSQFDDPEPPEEKHKEDISKGIQLQATKDRKSLAELYEQKYLEVVHGIDPNEEQNLELEKLKQEIQVKVSDILHQLNKLSSFSYIAPPTKPPTIQHKNSKPELAIQKEESTILPRSLETTHAPEEIMEPVKYLPAGETEISQNERKRKRRQKKFNQRKKSKKTEEFINDYKLTKKDGKVAKQITGDAAKDTSKIYSQSKAFFNMLQEKVDMETSDKGKRIKKHETDLKQHDKRRKARAQRM